MSLRERTRPGLGIIEPCLPSPTKAPPSGPGFLHEIKHDGIRILPRRDSAGVRLITRNGNNFTHWHCVEAPWVALSLWTFTAQWVKVKNPNAPAVKREAEEDWGR